MRNAASDAPVYASYIARAAAFLVDWAIVLLIAAFISTGASSDDRARAAVLLVTVSLYHIGCLIALGATPGKMALRCHVSDPDGHRLEPDRVILRFLVLLVSVLTVAGLFVSAALILVDPQRRALHDRIANTRVRYGRPSWAEEDRRY